MRLAFQARVFLDIPTPKVLSWNGDSQSKVESEYIRTEETPETRLSDFWQDMRLIDRIKIVDGIVGIEKKLLSLSFTRFVA
jgi:hypothetical protein